MESRVSSNIDESASTEDRLQELMLAILGDDTEVVIAECSRLFDPWFMAHMIELLTAKSKYAQTLLREEQHTLGGISLEELHRLFYSQVLSSHQLTWQLAPVYLSACPRQGLGMLETLLIKQPVSNSDRLALKVCLLSHIGETLVLHISVKRHHQMV
jgi:nuclear pore complex protein Nup85